MRQVLGNVLVRAPKVRKEYIHVTGTGTAVITLGAQYATLVDNGGTGDYTLTLTYPGSKFLGGSLTCVGTTARHAQFKDAPTATVANIVTFDLATPSAADAVFIVGIEIQEGLTNEF